MTFTQDTIRQLHAEYCQLTRQTIALNYTRESQWAEWLRWRREQMFTVDDLRCVIQYLQGRIRSGDRRPESLAFRNLVGMPDYFEEDLGLARIAMRPRYAPRPRVVRTQTAPGVVTERQLANPGEEITAKPVSETALKLLREFKETLK